MQHKTQKITQKAYKYINTHKEKKRKEKQLTEQERWRGLDWTVYGGQRSGRLGRTKNA